MYVTLTVAMEPASTGASPGAPARPAAAAWSLGDPRAMCSTNISQTETLSGRASRGPVRVAGGSHL